MDCGPSDSKKRLIVVDIGTHKAQEARTIADRSLFFELSMLWSFAKHYRWRVTAAFADFISVSRCRAELRGVDSAFVFVEPIAYRQLRAFLPRLGAFAYIGGVCSQQQAVGWTDLWLARNGLGNSLFSSKPNLTGRKLSVWNVNFMATLDWVDKNFRTGSDDLLILRMNAEGVELEVLEALAAHQQRGEGCRVDAVFGSLGDIRKCFGKEAWEVAQGLLEEMSLPYVYFTSNPSSWAPALKQLAGMLEGSAVRA